MDFVKAVKNIIYQDKINNAGKLDLYLPENKKCIALLIFFHGGGLEEGDKEDNKEINFSYDYRHLSYDYGGHMFVPMEFGQTKLFKGDRGKNKEPGLKARLDSLEKTLEFVSKW